MLSFRRFATVVALAFATMLPLTASAEVTMIYLVRHGEKGAGNDPALTPEGVARARNIATTLGKANIAQIYSSNYLRTKQTAEPLSTKLNVPVQTYDPGKQAAFAKQVLALKGNTLIVGHSNTLTELVRLLGGQAGGDIADDEFNRLYQLALEKDGSITTTLLHSVP